MRNSHQRKNISRGFFNASKKRKSTQNVLTVSTQSILWRWYQWNNLNTYDSQSDNDNLVINFDKEQEYKEDYEFKEYSSMVSKTNDFKISESKV